MSNAITLLEQMGQDASLAHAENQVLVLALANAQIDASMQAAILGRDQARVEALLGASPNVFCGFFPGKKEDEDEEEPSKDDDEISLQMPVLSFA